jgi:choice-of-anchor A domain-containing protein
LVPLLGGLAAIGTASPASAQNQTIPQYLGNAGPLGAGAPWAMISLRDFTANGPGTDNGNVAVGSGSATINNPFTINGQVFLGSGVQYQSNVNPSGGESSNPSLVNSAINDAKSASSQFSAMTPTQTVGELGNNSSITSSGPGAFNVIDAPDVNITNGTLTINGDANSSFVINLSGDFRVSNGGVVLSGGVKPYNIAWNIGGNLTITGGGPATFYGEALVLGAAPSGAATVHDDTWNGEIIAGTITDTSGFTVNSQVPIGAVGGLLLAGALGIALVVLQRRRRRSRLQTTLSV